MAKKKSGKAKPVPKKKATAKKSAAKKPAPVRRRRSPKISATEIEQRLERARNAARVSASQRSSIQGRVGGWFESLQETARKKGFPSLLKVAFAPATKEMQRRAILVPSRGKDNRPVWVAAGRFVFRPAIGYVQLHDVVTAWSTKAIAKMIGAERYARIVVEYGYDSKKGHALSYTIAQTLPWVWAIEAARNMVDPENDSESFGNGLHGSLAVRYGAAKRDEDDPEQGTVLRSVVVWLAQNEAHDAGKKAAADALHLRKKRKR